MRLSRTSRGGDLLPSFSSVCHRVESRMTQVAWHFFFKQKRLARWGARKWCDATDHAARAVTIISGFCTIFCLSDQRDQKHSCHYKLKGQSQIPLCCWAASSSSRRVTRAPTLREVIPERRGQHFPGFHLSLWYFSLRREPSIPELKDLMKRESNNCLQRSWLIWATFYK